MKKHNNRVVLRPEHRQELHDLRVIANHHRTLAAQADASLAQLLRVGYAIDITKDDWEILDEQRGILERRQGIGPDELQ